MMMRHAKSGWETQHKEELSLLQESKHKQLPGTLVRKTVKAGQADGWSELMMSEE